MALAVLLAGYGLTINVLAFALFGNDKRRASAGAWRIRESTLIGAALAGGWLGAKAGQCHFRHKTRKQPFARRLNAAVLPTVGFLALVAAAVVSPPGVLDVMAGSLADALEGVAPVFAGETWQGDSAPPARQMPTRFGPGSGDGM